MCIRDRPKITISGSTTLYMENNEQEATSTLTVNYTDIDDAAQKPVTWSIESGAEVITLTYPSNPNDKNTQAIITAKRGGKAKITATAGAYKDVYKRQVRRWASPRRMSQMNIT